MMTDTSTRLSTIGQITLVIKDLARAVEFYRDRLGMRFLFQAPPSLAFFDCDGIRLMLSPPEKPGDEACSGSVLYFRVKDIAAAHVDLERKGVAFLQAPHLIARMPDHELWMAFFSDSEGNTLALMEERR
jgi:methylmalonyl-CoA/ethylmalonyl-CoA epimerase